MKLVKGLTLLALCTLPAAGIADWYLGAKVGTMRIGFDDNTVDSDPASVGIAAAYRFESILQGGLSAEVEITRGITSGEVSGFDLDVESQGIYVAYTTQGRYYLKGRLGLMDAALTAGDLSEDEGGETYGLAAGTRIGQWALELDVTSIDDDVTFLSVGVVWNR
ncbi:MAG: outer membrane beta-barrel protein [Granulosicoccus sp.]